MLTTITVCLACFWGGFLGAATADLIICICLKLFRKYPGSK